MLPGRLWVSRIVPMWSFIDFPALYVTTVHRIILQNHKLFRLNDPSLKHQKKKGKIHRSLQYNRGILLLTRAFTTSWKAGRCRLGHDLGPAAELKERRVRKMFMKCRSCPFGSFCNRFSLLCCCCCFPSPVFCVSVFLFPSHLVYLLSCVLLSYSGIASFSCLLPSCLLSLFFLLFSIFSSVLLFLTVCGMTVYFLKVFSWELHVEVTLNLRRSRRILHLVFRPTTRIQCLMLKMFMG